MFWRHWSTNTLERRSLQCKQQNKFVAMAKTLDSVWWVACLVSSAVGQLCTVVKLSLRFVCATHSFGQTAQQSNRWSTVLQMKHHIEKKTYVWMRSSLCKSFLWNPMHRLQHRKNVVHFCTTRSIQLLNIIISVLSPGTVNTQWKQSKRWNCRVEVLCNAEENKLLGS